MARLIVIFAAIVGVCHGSDDDLSNDDTLKFAGLLGDPDVRQFIDGVLAAADVPDDVTDSAQVGAAEGRSLGDVAANATANATANASAYSYEYVLCDKCIDINSMAIGNYLVQKIQYACFWGPLASPSAETFCWFLNKGIISLDQKLNGYIFTQGRGRQLAIGVCIGTKQCSQKDAFNAYLNPTIPNRLVNFKKYRDCPSPPYPCFEDCLNDMLPRLLSFAVHEVHEACHDYYDYDYDLGKFCDYYHVNEHFAYGMVLAYAGVYQHAEGYCLRDYLSSS
ncbi:hypothetical protein FOZ63_032382 [Perkinsus olseni]|uniref:Uncharacterized protein n=1 Tax=Perkinsus olseni TaxID=32597 RepID=A0A7J6PPX9_PEROL|nr:hypothetical protein FOZ62_002556 [Perkinsus olseni]KAF4706194.1 hypothetical protein FOZ63_032382 [Perkinsus olseni]